MEDYENDLLENEPCTSCPSCQRDYDEIDCDFQCCSKCGWDVEDKDYKPHVVRHPSNEDYLNGDADVLTGEWT